MYFYRHFSHHTIIRGNLTDKTALPLHSADKYLHDSSMQILPTRSGGISSVEHILQEKLIESVP